MIILKLIEFIYLYSLWYNILVMWDFLCDFILDKLLMIYNVFVLFRIFLIVYVWGFYVSMDINLVFTLIKFKVRVINK